MTARIFIDGEHGTTGLQIRSRLEGRSDIELMSIPEAERRDPARRQAMMRRADIAILCLPDDAAREAVGMLCSESATRIIDTSTAHRVDPEWAYGFAELDAYQADRIRTARLVANPGCYPTGAIALLRPLRDAGLLGADMPVTVNAVSGYTGGGKQLIAQMEDATRPDHIAAPHFLYGLNLEHKHLPEMRVFGRLDTDPIFAPSVGRFPQGMIVQIPLHRQWLADATTSSLREALAQHYRSTSAVEVVDAQTIASLSRIDPTELAGTDRMRLFVFGSKDDTRINLVALLDNLGKGASGAAVQNMDLMLSAK